MFFANDAFFTNSSVSLLSLPYFPSKLNEGKLHTDRVMKDDEFNEWFVGFTDAEGCFRIAINNKVVRFNFIICLHVDDKEVLEFMKSRLNCGTISKTGKSLVSFYISKQEDLLNILIPLFDNFPLNGVKYLDYLTFKEAILNKLDNSIPLDKKLELITNLKNSMNTKRESFFAKPAFFLLHKNYTLVITRVDRG